MRGSKERKGIDNLGEKIFKSELNVYLFDKRIFDLQFHSVIVRDCGYLSKNFQITAQFFTLVLNSFTSLFANAYINFSVVFFFND